VERPKETTYLDEMYRATYEALGKRIYVTSEWSGRDSRKSVDFMISSRKWGIEILRDSDKIDEHLERFRPGGRYWKCIDNHDMEDWVVLNIGIVKPSKKRSTCLYLFLYVGSLSNRSIDEPRLFHVLLVEEYREAIILDSQLDEVKRYAILN
jgi:hypothetical protein